VVMRPTWILGCSAVLALAALPASAQPVVAAKSGTISLAEGKVLMDEKPLDIQPGQFPDLKEKSTLRTEEGRAEVLLPPGMFLRVGENASVRMISNRLIDTRVELLSGSGVVEIDAASKDAQVTMIAKNASVTFAKGIYRFDSDPARLRVFEGTATVEVDGRTVAVASGKMIGLTSDTASVEHFDVKDTDALDHWSRRRGEEVAMANVSAAHRASTSSWAGGYNPCMSGYGYGSPYGAPYMPSAYALGPGTMGGGAWTYNPWYGMITYMPCSGMLWSPYGYGFWSPYAVGNLFGYGYGLYPHSWGYGYGGGTPVRVGTGGGAGRSGAYSGITRSTGWSGLGYRGGTTSAATGSSGSTASSGSTGSMGRTGGGGSSGGGFSGGGFSGGHGGAAGGGGHR